MPVEDGPIELMRKYPERVDRALWQGVRDALIRHKQAGVPIAVSRDGKVVLIPPEEIEIPDLE